jgi:hypothetical protein
MTEPLTLYSPTGEEVGTFEEITNIEYKEAVETLLESLQDRVEMVRNFEIQYDEDKLPETLNAGISFLNNYEQQGKDLRMDIEYSNLAQSVYDLYQLATTKIHGLGTVENHEMNVLDESFLETYSEALSTLGHAILHNLECYQAIFWPDYKYFRNTEDRMPLALPAESVPERRDVEDASQGMYI